MYMELPKGIKPSNEGQDLVLKLKKNFYGQKQAGRQFFLHMKKGVESIGFQQSAIDECIFYRGTTVFVVYVDDVIFFDKDENKIDQAIKNLQDEKYDIEIKGDVKDYLGINVHKRNDGKIELTQQLLIDQIIKDMGLDHIKRKVKSTPAPSSYILQRQEKEESFDGRFDYRSVIGKLNFLEKSTRLDIAYAIHQCARFSADPKNSHGEAVIHIGNYLRGSRDKGIILDPTRDDDEILKVYVDAYWSGNWHKSTSAVNSSTAKSRSGFVISFSGCPILWQSKLQTQVAFSTTEAEYIALSQSMREMIPIMQIFEELTRKRIVKLKEKPEMFCKAFEDNTGALELATVPKLRSRTKHINLVYHHFREHV